MKRLALLLILLTPCFASAPPFSVHQDPAKYQKWPHAKADLLYYETIAAVAAEMCGNPPCIKVRLDGFTLEFRPNSKDAGYDCGTKRVWMPKWDDGAFSLAIGYCVRAYFPAMTDTQFKRAVHRALVSTNARYFYGE
jgi:hypothetical protein